MRHAERISEYEAGLLDEDEVIEFFQEMINDGIVWHLQGSYQRVAVSLIRSGACTMPPLSEFKREYEIAPWAYDGD